MQDMISPDKFWNVSITNHNNDCSRVMRELECAKRELFQLKLDVASVLKEKLEAEKKFEASRSSMLSCSSVAQSLRKEIEEANEEQVIVELARIDALKELEEIEAWREKEAKELSSKLESTRNTLKEAIQEINESKELEKNLATTMSDIDVLKNELKLVKKIDKRVEIEGSLDEGKESRDVSVLHTTKNEAEGAKKNLALIREKGFEFMASMDDIRNELKNVNAATVQLNNMESKIGSKFRNLSCKLLRAKSKLEAASAAEEKAKSIVRNLSHTLGKVKSEAEAARKEKELIDQEITATKEEIKKASTEIDVREERLQGAMQELEAVKSSESLALEKLKTLSENAKRERSLVRKPSCSLITISKFEYEYLSNHAAEADVVADKKVEAAKAWIEAFKESEKEIVMMRKIAEGKLEEWKEEKLVSTSNEELESWPRKREKKEWRELKRTMSRKSIKSEGSMTPSKGSKLQKSISPAPRPTTPFIVKKKKKLIPSFTKFLRGQRIMSKSK